MSDIGATVFVCLAGAFWGPRPGKISPSAYAVSVCGSQLSDPSTVANCVCICMGMGIPSS